MKDDIEKEHESAGSIDRVAADRLGERVNDGREAVREQDELDDV